MKQFIGYNDPGESWKVEIEYDCMAEGNPFVVTILTDYKEPGEKAFTLICVEPWKARQMADALIGAADEADRANKRKREK